MSIKQRRNKPVYSYRSIYIIASRRSLSEQLLVAILRTVARPYNYSPKEEKHLQTTSKNTSSRTNFVSKVEARKEYDVKSATFGATGPKGIRAYMQTCYK